MISLKLLCDKSRAFSFVNLLALNFDKKLCERFSVATRSLIVELKFKLKLVRFASDKFKIKFSVDSDVASVDGEISLVVLLLVVSIVDTIVSRRLRVIVDGCKLPWECNNKLFMSVLKSNKLS